MSTRPTAANGATNYDALTSLLPRRGIENTEIALEHHDDDVSAISAHTLNEMYTDEIRLLGLNDSRNSDGDNNNNDSGNNHSNINVNPNANVNINISPNANNSNHNKDNTCSTPTYYEYGKENISDVGSHLSMKSSSETTEFESIWRTKSAGSPSSNSNADNCNTANRDSNPNCGPIYRDKRFTRNRETKRSPMTRSPFATIDENDLLYIDEEEI